MMRVLSYLGLIYCKPASPVYTFGIMTESEERQGNRCLPLNHLCDAQRCENIWQRLSQACLKPTVFDRLC